MCFTPTEKLSLVGLHSWGASLACVDTKMNLRMCNYLDFTDMLNLDRIMNNEWES